MPSGAGLSHNEADALLQGQVADNTGSDHGEAVGDVATIGTGNLDGGGSLIGLLVGHLGGLLRGAGLDGRDGALAGLDTRSNRRDGSLARLDTRRNRSNRRVGSLTRLDTRCDRRDGSLAGMNRRNRRDRAVAGDRVGDLAGVDGRGGTRSGAGVARLNHGARAVGDGQVAGLGGGVLLAVEGEHGRAGAVGGVAADDLGRGDDGGIADARLLSGPVRLDLAGNEGGTGKGGNEDGLAEHVEGGGCLGLERWDKCVCVCVSGTTEGGERCLLRSTNVV